MYLERAHPAFLTTLVVLVFKKIIRRTEIYVRSPGRNKIKKEHLGPGPSFPSDCRNWGDQFINFLLILFDGGKIYDKELSMKVT